MPSEVCKNYREEKERFLDRFYPDSRNVNRCIGSPRANLGPRISDPQYYDVAEDLAQKKTYYQDLLNSGFKEPGDDYRQKRKKFHLLSQLIEKKLPNARSANLYSWYDRRPNGDLRCIYSNRLLSDGVTGEYTGVKFNEEHSFPQSWQHSSRAGTGRDAHHIFACDQHVNGSRGNKALGDGGVRGVAMKLNKSEISQDSESSAREDVHAREGFDIYRDPDTLKTFALPHKNRDVLARAALYVIVSYPGILFKKQIGDESLRWYIQNATGDPSLWEKHRNKAIFEVQGNRNPFVDFPEWVSWIDFDEGLDQADEIGKRSADFREQVKNKNQMIKADMKKAFGGQGSIIKSKSFGSFGNVCLDSGVHLPRLPNDKRGTIIEFARQDRAASREQRRLMLQERGETRLEEKMQRLVRKKAKKGDLSI